MLSLFVKIDKKNIYISTGLYKYPMKTHKWKIAKKNHYVLLAI